MTRFIVIAGKKQSGKDTLARMLVEELEEDGFTAEIVSFADPLKRACHIVFGIPLELMYGSDRDKESLTTLMWDGLPKAVCKKYHPLQGHYRTGAMTVREVLQVIGTDIFRECVYQDVWAAAPFVAKYESDFVIIPDGRFPNEVEYGMNAGAVTIRIKRDTGLVDQHTSETSLDGTPDSAFNFVYNNGGTLDDLRSFAEDIVSELENEIANIPD